MDRIPLFVGDAELMLGILRDRSVEIASGAFSPNDKKIPADARPGDLILVKHINADGEFLDHVALVIDDAVIFEKAGIGSFVPYRLTDIATLLEIWDPRVYEFELRRPLAPVNLPEPQNTFGLHHPQAIERFPQLAGIPGIPRPPTQYQLGNPWPGDRRHNVPKNSRAKPISSR